MSAGLPASAEISSANVEACCGAGDPLPDPLQRAARDPAGMFAGGIVIDDKRGEGREQQLLGRGVLPRHRVHAPQLTKDEISFWELVSPQRAGLKIGQERRSGLRVEVLKIAPQALGRVLTVGHTAPIQMHVS
jgi:hypothetical protein